MFFFYGWSLINSFSMLRFYFNILSSALLLKSQPKKEIEIEKEKEKEKKVWQIRIALWLQKAKGFCCTELVIGGLATYIDWWMIVASSEISLRLSHTYATHVHVLFFFFNPFIFWVFDHWCLEFYFSLWCYDLLGHIFWYVMSGN